MDFSAAIGRPLNNYVVIHLHESPAAAAATLFERIRHKFRDWWNRHAKKDVAAQLPPPLYTYTLENPNGAPHVNWVIHIPASLQAEFEAKLPRWVERVQGAVGKFDIDIQPVNPAYAKRLAKYIVKGTDPEFIAHFFLGGVHAPQGSVAGKRAGTSLAIGAAVRRESGFKPSRRRYQHKRANDDGQSIARAG